MQCEWSCVWDLGGGGGDLWSKPRGTGPAGRGARHELRREGRPTLLPLLRLLARAQPAQRRRAVPRAGEGGGVVRGAVRRRGRDQERVGDCAARGCGDRVRGDGVTRRGPPRRARRRRRDGLVVDGCRAEEGRRRSRRRGRGGGRTSAPRFEILSGDPDVAVAAVRVRARAPARRHARRGGARRRGVRRERAGAGAEALRVRRRVPTQTPRPFRGDRVGAATARVFCAKTGLIDAASRGTRTSWLCSISKRASAYLSVRAVLVFAAVFGEMPPAYAARLAMECSSPASGHRASRNSRKREAIPVSSFESALAARLWHSPPRRRASVASAASSRAPAAAPRRALSSSSAHLRNRLAHALHRNTSNAPRLTACPVHVPHPKHLCIHPAEGMFVPGTYVCAFGSSFETPAFVPDRCASRAVPSRAVPPHDGRRRRQKLGVGRTYRGVG